MVTLTHLKPMSHFCTTEKIRKPLAHLTFTCSKVTIDTLEKGVNYVQS